MLTLAREHISKIIVVLLLFKIAHVVSISFDLNINNTIEAISVDIDLTDTSNENIEVDTDELEESCHHQNFTIQKKSIANNYATKWVYTNRGIEYETPPPESLV